MVETLKIVGRKHILVSTTLLGREIKNSTVVEINAEKGKFMAICYILRNNEVRYNKLLDDLNISTNCGRDEYPVSCTRIWRIRHGQATKS